MRGLVALMVVLLIAYMLSGFFMVKPYEVGVVKRFGKFVREVPPGLNYHLPYPIETVLIPDVTKVRRLELGFRTQETGLSIKIIPVSDESLMLTGDENLVDVRMIVQYKVKSPRDFLFSVRDPDGVVKQAAESAIRHVTGTGEIDRVLTYGRDDVERETGTLLQNILDNYEAGIHVITVQLQDVFPPQPVIAAFNDVAAAREDKEKFINEAEGYQNDLLPTARGEAQKLLREAEAYRASRIAMAEGDVARFLAVYEEYKDSKDVTKTRLYLEAMEDILANKRLIIADSDGILKVLPLGEYMGDHGRKAVDSYGLK
jgi:membrane protease subunit HflK